MIDVLSAIPIFTLFYLENQSSVKVIWLTAQCLNYW